jgi:hypothetical protein
MLGQADLMNATSRPVAAKTAFTAPRFLPPALWASAAAIALLLAILAGRSDLGAQRAAIIVSSLNLGSHQPLGPGQVTPAPFDAESATRQLARAVRGLAEDRDRLTAPLTALEHNVDDMTGSISRQVEAAKAAGAEPLAPLASPAPWPDAPATGAAIPWRTRPPPWCLWRDTAPTSAARCPSKRCRRAGRRFAGLTRNFSRACKQASRSGTTRGPTGPSYGLWSGRFPTKKRRRNSAPRSRLCGSSVSQRCSTAGSRCNDGRSMIALCGVCRPCVARFSCRLHARPTGS